MGRQEWIFNDSDRDRSYVESVYNQLKRVEEMNFELNQGMDCDEIGFSDIDSSIFCALVLTRVSQPEIKLKAVEYMRRNHGIEYDLCCIYRIIDNLQSDNKNQEMHRVENMTYWGSSFTKIKNEHELF